VSRARRKVGWHAHYLRGVCTALRHNQVAYAYSATMTALFGVVHDEARGPNVGQCFLFIVGAGVAFAVVNTSVTKLFRERLPREPSEVVALGTALSLFSMAASLGAGTLVAWLSPPWVAWGVSPLAASIAFMITAGVEMGLAGLVHDAGGA
jgi:hypothetical protein